MKKVFSRYRTLLLKILPHITCIIIGLLSFSHGEAQSIVGKWKRTFTKIFVTDKASGKQVPASAEMQKTFDEHANGYNETLEIKSNNTYISSVSVAGGGEPKVDTGAYSLSGQNLDMNIPLVHNEKTTITIQSVNSNSMVWQLLFMGKKTEITYTKSN
jgi:hypothetical protein